MLSSCPTGGAILLWPVSFTQFFTRFRASLKAATASNVSLTILNTPPRAYATIAADSQPPQNQTGGSNVNVTYLLNNLLRGYDNSLRPDLGGKTSNAYLINLISISFGQMLGISDTNFSIRQSPQMYV